MRRKLSPSVESLEGRALMSVAVTPVTQPPAQVQIINQKLYALTKGVLDTVYKDVLKPLTKQLSVALQAGNTTRASLVQGEITQVTTWYQQTLASLCLGWARSPRGRPTLGFG